MPYADPSCARARAANRKRQQKWRKSPQGKAVLREKRREKRLERPFVGVDGEGAGTNEHGQQNYVLLRAGEHELWHGGRRLTSEECLGFLADLPAGPIYVGFFFGYDTTQILRDLPEHRIARLLSPPKDAKTGQRAPVDWRGFQIEYLRKKHLRVRRKGSKKWTTISDVSSFFQCAFVKALETWQIGTVAQRARIQAGKSRRGGEKITREDRKYCELECRFLAELMDRFRAVCNEAGYLPGRWEGPGYLASAMLRANEVPKRKEVSLPPELAQLAVAAYYGGRFELFHVGRIGRAFSYDINSAYPAAMRGLPCLLHGRWVRTTKPATSPTFPHLPPWIADVSFRKEEPRVCDLPVRTPERCITWPRQARGVYWGVELEAAQRAGTTYRIHEAWQYEPQCDCQPFAWVEDVYRERKRIGKSGKGLVLKLGINSLYGKTAQSIGAAPYASPVWAGLITATTRATIIDAYRRIPSEAVVMIATDGIYTTVPIPGLDVSDELGAWEASEEENVLTVQPGCYFTGEKVRSRGVSRSMFGPHRDRFEKTIAASVKAGRTELGAVVIPVKVFIGISLAHHLGKPEAAGVWKETERRISFDPYTKRGRRLEFAEGHVRTYAQPGGPELVSVPYDRTFGLESDAFMDQLTRDEQPDFWQLVGE